MLRANCSINQCYVVLQSVWALYRMRVCHVFVALLWNDVLCYRELLVLFKLCPYSVHFTVFTTVLFEYRIVNFKPSNICTSNVAIISFVVFLTLVFYDFLSILSLKHFQLYDNEKKIAGSIIFIEQSKFIIWITVDTKTEDWKYFMETLWWRVYQ